MTVALGLIAGAVLVAVLGPCYLRAAVTPRVRPSVALTGWMASVVIVVGAATAGATLLLVPHNESADGVIGMTRSCINVPPGGPNWQHVLRLGAAALVFGALLRVAFVAAGLSCVDRMRRREHLSALMVLTRAEPGSPVLWLDQATPVAYSLGGRRGSIVATTGVSRMPPAEREAILQHERAHLRGRHHILVLMVEILARALPFVPLFRAAPPAVRVLVELAADAAAARACGAGPVLAALRAVTGDAVPSGSLAMSRESVELRLHWLVPARRGSVLRHRAACVVAACASASPALVGVGVVAALALLYCFGVRTG
jgi:Zn-dependent protease with chaperone function